MELEEQIAMVGSKLLMGVIRDFVKGIVKRMPQDHEKATLAPKIELEDCEVIWSQPAQILHNLVRGSTPHPGAWCYVSAREQKKRLKILKTRFVGDMSGPPGTILATDKEGVVIACGQNALKLIQVQLEGKKAMTATELLRGVPLDFS
jgi:methionyl-tRNA formyltransferase